MSSYYPTWQDDLEPNQTSVRQWLENIYTKVQPLEQARWNQSNIDTLFYAGAQTFVNRYFNFNANTNSSGYYFNLIQQNINMVTGYQRQHRKAPIVLPINGSDGQTADQFTKALISQYNRNGIHEQISRGFEQSCITGMVLAQPYLDYSGDAAQGDIKLKIWEYNSFLVDPYFRDFGMEDCSFVWTQEYISKREAKERFPGKVDKISPMAGAPQRYGSFYFLPENYNMNRNDLMVLSYVWYKYKKSKKRLYSKSTNQFFDFSAGDEEIAEVMLQIKDLEMVTVDVPSWKLAVILNDQLMYQGFNPLGFDSCPFIMLPWNYEPHINYYDLRVRGLVRTMRDAQYLLNRRIILNHDISESSINSGYIRKVGAVANEDTLMKPGQGYQIIINEGYEMSDFQKIVPNVVPQSDMALADQLQSLIFSTSGINLENWSAQDQPNASALTSMIKQAANLTVLQKYFDQWDFCAKQIAEKCIEIMQYNFGPTKIALLIGEEPSPFFYSRIFSQYQVTVEEALLTPTQRSLHAQQLLDINSLFGREVFPPSMVVKDMNMTGRSEAVQYLQQQEQQMQQQQAEMQGVAHAFEEAKLKELYSRAVSNLAQARERQGRAESNIGLLEERLSEVSKNQSLSVKAKMESIQALLDTIAKYGEIETALKSSEIESYGYGEDLRENTERDQAKQSSESNKFLTELMGELPIGMDQGAQSTEQPPAETNDQSINQMA